LPLLVLLDTIVTGTAGIIFPIYQQVCPSDDT